jgi:L-fuconolactonase
MTAVVDSHIHFWDPAARHHDWLDEVPALRRRFGPEDLDAGRHEVRAAVFVQADCRDDEARQEVRWVQELAGEHGFIRGIVAYAPVHLGARAEEHLAPLTGERLVVGVRRLLQGGPAEAIVDRDLVAGVGLLSGYGLTFDICVTHEQLPAVAALVAECPETTFVLDHLGKPPVASGRLEPWRGDIARIALFPNVTCKLSGLATEAGRGWLDGDVRPYLEHALEVFAPARCMVGSDWPVAGLQTTYEHWLDVVVDLVSGLSDDERAAVLGGTAAETYGLDLEAAVPR